MVNGRINGNRLRIGLRVGLRVGAPVLGTGLAGFADGISAASNNLARFIPFFNANIRDNSKKRIQNSHREGQCNLRTDQCDEKFDLHCERLIVNQERCRIYAVLKTQLFDK